MEPINCQEASFEELVNAFKNQLPIAGIDRILTHMPPVHIDEIGAVHLLRDTEKGLSLFPGIDKAVIAFTSTTELLKNGYKNFGGFIRALQNGYLIIGLGGGPFDEHHGRDKHISCFETVIRYLNLLGNKEGRSLYNPLRWFINHEDNNGDNLVKNLNKVDPGTRLSSKAAQVLKTLNMGMIAQNIKKGFESAVTPLQQENVFKMGMQFIKHEIDYQKLFLAAQAQCDILESKQYFDFGNDHFGLVVHSDNPLISRAIHQKVKMYKGLPLGVLVICNSKNQFVILPQQGLKNEMIEVGKILRQKVYFAKNQKQLPAEVLGEFGTIDPIPEIYIDQNQSIIMNGSKTDPDVEGLIGKYISVEDIIEAIRIVVEEQFDPKFAQQCSSGKCEGKRCLLYHYNLKHCSMVRTVNNVSKIIS